MNNQIGYALWNRKNPVMFDYRFPIYWTIGAAREAQKEYGGEIVKVFIKPLHDSNLDKKGEGKL